MKSQIQFDELQTILSDPNLNTPHFQGSLRHLCVAVCKDLKVTRVGFWLQNGQTFENFQSWSSDGGALKSEGIGKASVQKFYKDILSRPQGAINALHINSYKEELESLFFAEDGIKAICWVHVYVRGKFVGFLMVEHDDHRVWKQPEILYLMLAANQVGNTYYTHIQDKKKVALQTSRLFEENTLPVFICDLASKKILGVNPQAEIQYGYKEKDLIGREFWALGSVHEIIKDSKKTSQFFKGTHRSRAGRKFNVKVAAFATTHMGKKVWACLIIDQEEETSLSYRNEELYNRLADHAFFTSHSIRGPLANILGLIDLIPHTWDDKKNYEEIIYRLKTQAVVLEETIRVMAAKVEVD